MMKTGGIWDELNTRTCSRCGGTGRYPSSYYGGICMKCNGAQVATFTPKGQAAKLRKLHVRVEYIQDAKVGDVAMVYGTAVRVLEIVWRKPGATHTDNQRVMVERVVDGKRGYITRTAYGIQYPIVAWTIKRHEDGTEERVPCSTNIQPTPAMLGQLAEMDEAGEWKVWDGPAIVPVLSSASTATEEVLAGFA